MHYICPIDKCIGQNVQVGQMVGHIGHILGQFIGCLGHISIMEKYVALEDNRPKDIFDKCPRVGQST